MLIHKREIAFQIDPEETYSARWYPSKYSDWEEESFDILDAFLAPDQDFLDIGAWIGPLTLYAAHKSRHVHALEPDPVAFDRLHRNCLCNPDLNNVSLHQLGLSDANSSQSFGGNGELGNSESSLLVTDADYLNTGGESAHWMGDNPDWRKGESTTVPVLTFPEFVRQQSIDLAEVSLIKVDIEGSEKIALPSMLSMAEACQAPLFLSLHWDFLRTEDITTLVELLFACYPKLVSPAFKEISQSYILEQKLSEILALPA